MMNNKYLLSLLSFLLIVSLSNNNALAAKKSKKSAKPAQTAPLVNDYPTRDRVEYVLNCIAQHNGSLQKISYVTQYACGCKLDKVAEKLSFAEFEAAKTFTYLSKGLAGEAGAPFRDPKQSKDLRSRLKEAEEAAEKSCFVGKPKSPVATENKQPATNDKKPEASQQKVETETKK